MDRPMGGGDTARRQEEEVMVHRMEEVVTVLREADMGLLEVGMVRR